MKITEYELFTGFYPGVLIGMRSYYNNPEKQYHVLYLPFIEIGVTVTKHDRNGYT